METYFETAEKEKKNNEKEINYLKKQIFSRSLKDISYVKLGNTFIEFENESGYYKYLQNKS